MDGTVTEQGRRGGKDSQGQQPGKQEQAHARGGDLGDGAEADHRPSEA
jgi:hypothetical protein